MGNFYLNSYIPLITFKDRLADIERLGIPPYVDASCRREPDFESESPPITGLCRGDKFVTRLRVGDKVVYRTKKGRYDNRPELHWRIVAGLEVIAVLRTHDEAKQWYQKKGLSLPINCMVAGNKPKSELECTPLRKTRDKHTSIWSWDNHYRARARACGLVAVCKPIWIELHEPPVWTEMDELKTFGRQMATRNPPRITKEQFKALLRSGHDS